MAEAWRDDDRRRIAEHGLAIAEVERQLALLRNPPPAICLLRPATPGDGVRVLAAAEAEDCRAAWRSAAAAGRFTSFVPASGAASRMFRSLLAERGRGGLRRDAIAERAASGDRDAAEVLEFVDRLARFAFAGELERELARRGEDLSRVQRGGGDLGGAIAALLDPGGLGYAEQAKGLLLFHRYPDGPRTAFEEHLTEGAAITRDARGLARLHFTVSPQHRGAFEAALERLRARVEQRTGARFAVAFSEQSPASDTVAIDESGAPFRDADGRLLFRPGGHGSLIGNLAELGADLLLVKNIDNIVPDDRRPICVHWKQVLGGLVAALQERVFAALAELDGDPTSAAAADRALALLADELDCPPPEEIARADLAARAAFARRLLARPLRVCGVVRATGDPGGGPFWVAGADGRASLQIVETAQIDLGDPQQKAIFQSSTHFNPVDLACALRDRHGRPFDLRRHVDPTTAFLSEKSSGGRTLRALEHPGLWNGAMADWTTVFVEVPLETFNPVKTVNDLLRPEHQPP